MRGKRISMYAASLLITIVGGLATYLIVDAGTRLESEAPYAGLNPLDPQANFEKKP